MIKPLTIGLALSGGTAKSVAHVGVIKAIQESGINIDYISGTSGGAIAATAYASGMSLEAMERAANELSWGKLASIKFSRLGFVSSENIYDYMIEQFGDDIDFKQLNIPCTVLGTDLHTGLKYVFDSGSVAKAVQISCSLPHFFLPIEHKDKMLIDGGLSEYLPVQTVREMGAQFVIGANLGSQAGDYQKPKHILQLFMQVNNLVAKQNMRQSVQYADVLLEPDLTGFSAFDFDNSEKLIELMYQLTKSKIDEIQQAYNSKNKLFNRVRSSFKLNQVT